MSELTDALKIMTDRISGPDGETVTVGDALGRTLACDIYAVMHVPDFDSSLRDGFACGSQDTVGAAVRLRVIRQIAAGESEPGELAPGTCARIMTGAPLPLGADTVVAQEEVEYMASEIILCRPLPKGHNVARAGKDIERGSLTLPSGTVLGPVHLALLSALGLQRVRVWRQPRVWVVASGSELEQPGQPLAFGRIYDSNSSMLSSMARDCGCILAGSSTVPDRLEMLAAAIDEGLPDSDIMLISGGLAAGDFDLTEKAVRASGANVVYAGSPGSRTLPAMIATRNGKLIFCLTGKPSGAWTAFNLLVRPALLCRQGRYTPAVPLSLRLQHAALNNSSFDRYLPGVVSLCEGELLVTIAGHDRGQTLTSLGDANSLVHLPSNSSFAAADRVDVHITGQPQLTAGKGAFS